MTELRGSGQEYVKVKIVSGDDNAYRITLFNESIQFARKLILTGAELKTKLPSGTCKVIFESIGSTLLTEAFTVNIERDGQVLDLTRMMQEKRVEQATHQLTELPVKMTNLRRSDISRKFYSPIRLPFSFIPHSIDILHHIDFNRFTIGISQDMNPGMRGGWGPVQGLNIDQKVLENGHFQLRIKTDETNSEKRLRITFALQGKPVVRLPVPLYKPRVIIEFQPVFDLNGLDILVSINAENPVINVLTSAIHHLSESEAESVLRQDDLSLEDATEMFYYKRRDPWAATAAAVLLTSLRKLEPISRWAYNLEELTPYISDTAIVAAWAQVTEYDLSPEENERCILEHLILGRQRGAPNFVISSSLAISLLSILATSGTTATVRKKAKIEYSRWSNRGKRRVEAGSYFVWEKAGDNLQHGELTDRRYTIIQKGYLSEQGFVL